MNKEPEELSLDVLLPDVHLQQVTFVTFNHSEPSFDVKKKCMK